MRTDMKDVARVQKLYYGLSARVALNIVLLVVGYLLLERYRWSSSWPYFLVWVAVVGAATLWAMLFHERIKDDLGTAVSREYALKAIPSWLALLLIAAIWLGYFVLLFRFMGNLESGNLDVADYGYDAVVALVFGGLMAFGLSALLWYLGSPNDS